MRIWQKRYINNALLGKVHVTTKGGARFIGLLDEINEDCIILEIDHEGTLYWQVIDMLDIAAFAWQSGNMKDDVHEA